jgi:hypothetical protein
LEISTDDTADTLIYKLRALGEAYHIIWIAQEDKLSSYTEDVLEDRQSKGVIQVFRLIKALLQLGYGSRKLAGVLSLLIHVK